MANIDTPGYKTQGFDFDAEFAAALRAPTHGDGAAMNGAPRVEDVDGLVARPDGNTVSIDRETLQMAKSQLQFRTGVALLKSEYGRVMSAIHADAK
jgi:flagellar basal-body rod protein FlgB